MWSAFACLNQFVNSVVWANDSINRAPVWCDISIRITLAASLCINRRLYQIARAKPDTISAAQVSNAFTFWNPSNQSCSEPALNPDRLPRMHPLSPRLRRSAIHRPNLPVRYLRAGRMLPGPLWINAHSVPSAERLQGQR
ncbi:hypothetical protein C8F04DRAFT_181382 [Mycena alexandri]|uniref:Uncharacterized protein n=1 Tax=Mycena alexandri TaxID=1745969 RepID=A0AAD6S9G1_9AGAR|nr:hypothetical protein C8F04DRAFT_181094 [Mycena alexandri]KAJ7023545.1 hypothetical protein C8F04DRAFT_181382 [Mycena alexandri]